MARWQAVQSAFAAGDISAVFDNARRIALKSPRAAQAGDAIGVVRALTGVPSDRPLGLTDAERLERAVALMRDGDSIGAPSDSANAL